MELKADLKDKYTISLRLEFELFFMDINLVES